MEGVERRGEAERNQSRCQATSSQREVRRKSFTEAQCDKYSRMRRNLEKHATKSRDHISLFTSRSSGSLASRRSQKLSLPVGRIRYLSRQMVLTTTTPTATRYEMTLVGKPTTSNAKAKALAAGGPLLVAPDHVLAVMLPDALDRTTHAPQVVVRTTEMHGACIGGLLFEHAAAARGAHMAVEAARWATLLKDLDDAGCDFAPVRGEMKTAWPIVVRKLTDAIRHLPHHRVQCRAGRPHSRRAPDGSHFYEGGLQASMESPRQDGWD